MTITFKRFLHESINDKGIFKAVFVVGLPGAGKSYTVSKLGGTIQPRVVNTDRATEFLSKKHQEKVGSMNWFKFKDHAHRITEGSLYSYLTGMLPLFIDGTSNNAPNILHRAGILESLGYDVGMIFIDTSLETALKRAAGRARVVDPEFIKSVAAEANENREFFKSKFSFYKELQNDDGMLTDEVLLRAYKQVSGFFNEKLSNPIGRRALEELREQKQKYLVPTVLSEAELRKKLAGWYRS